MAFTKREADRLAAMTADAAADYDLNDEERDQLREHVAANARDLEAGDGWYWVGVSYIEHWLFDAAESIAEGDAPLSYLDYEERRADRACP